MQTEWHILISSYGYKNALTLLSSKQVVSLYFRTTFSHIFTAQFLAAPVQACAQLASFVDGGIALRIMLEVISNNGGGAR